jgi:phosphoglucosamine mutase
MTRWFRTDGVRGLANVELTASLALELGAAYVECLRAHQIPRPRLLLGRDTRISGPMLESAFAAGACARGGDVVRAGILPTPGVALLTRTLDGIHGGVMISASHNPIADNGVKLFGREGFKISDQLEASIEALLGKPELHAAAPTGTDVGTIGDLSQASAGYQEYLLAQAAPHRLDGLKVVLDCAHGAAWSVAPEVFRLLGAEVVTMHDTPDGERINVACGSTNLKPLQARVLAEKAALGLAFDGDADRCLAVDELGQAVDGDQMLLVFARTLLTRSQQAPQPVVATVMSNLGLEWALRDAGIPLLRAAVGDRFVLEEMRRHGATIGGEQSGHIIFLDSSTTGDGTLTALRLALAVTQSKTPLSTLTRMPQVPQLLVNVRTPRKDEVFSDGELSTAIAAAEAQLQGRGRLLVRASGTEPLVRVMAEGPEAAEIETLVRGLATLIEQRLAH